MYNSGPLPMNELILRVVAAVICRDGRYLITQRRPSAVLPGLWEFPGGRVEANETDADALAREVRERVDVDIAVGACIGKRTHRYMGYQVELSLYQATLPENATPRAARVADCRWVASDEFEKYPFPAADQASMDLLLGIRRG